MQLKPRATLNPGDPILVRHVADTVSTTGKEVLDLPIQCPNTPGVWKLPALNVVQAVSGVCAQVHLMGPDQCYVHILPPHKRNRTHAFRAIAAFLLLMIGSALAIGWFHADVNMAEAQQSLFRLICGRSPEKPWLITIPYAIGVFFGVALFYALLGRKGTISPLEIKLEDYRQSAEDAAGKAP